MDYPLQSNRRKKKTTFAQVLERKNYLITTAAPLILKYHYARLKSFCFTKMMFSSDLQ
ncbi:unnamed protein product, partial [Nesidiocoris tenuis]